MGDVFYPYCLVLDEVVIDCISEQGIDMAEDVRRPLADGQLSPMGKFTGVSADVITLTTRAIAKGLAKIPLTGFVLGATEKAVLHCQKAEHGGTRGGASKHLKVEIEAGFAIWRNINASPVGEAATMVIEIHTAEGGTNDPIVYTKLQTLPEDVLTAPQEYWAGPIKLNNSALAGQSDITIDSGITLRKRYSNSSATGDTGCDHISIRTIVPTISITTDQVDIVSDFKKAIDIASATHCYLRKGAIGTRTADATAEHIKFSATDGYIKGRNIGGAEQVGVIEVGPVDDGTNAILAIDPAIAIT